MRLAVSGDKLVCGEGDIFGATFISDSDDFTEIEITEIGIGPEETILLGVE